MDDPPGPGRGAADLRDFLSGRIAETQARVDRLEELRRDLTGSGDAGKAGAAEVRRHQLVLCTRRDRLVALLEDPSMAAALDGSGSPRALTPLWAEVARHLMGGGEEVDDEAFLRHRKSADAANSAARRLASEIQGVLPGLALLGPEEVNARLHVWLGRLRGYLDGFDLDDDAQRDIQRTFGEINSARRMLGIDGFPDPLSREFRTDWKQYVELWEERLERARLQDELDRREDGRLREEREGVRSLDPEDRRRHDLMIHEITQILREMAASEEWWSFPDQREEAREYLLGGMEAGGCTNDSFLAAARVFAPLVEGDRFRPLRRSLAGEGMDLSRDRSLSDARDRPDDPLFARLRPSWEGKRVVLVGGLPREGSRRRLERGLALASLRWFEYFRHRSQRDEAAVAIRAGGVDQVLLLARYAGSGIGGLRDVCRSMGVPFRTVETGCGVAAVLRTLRELEEPVWVHASESLEESPVL
jgi:hypothetical protein